MAVLSVAELLNLPLPTAHRAVKTSKLVGLFSSQQVGLGLVAVTTVAAKLHKFGVTGGGRLSPGAAAVIVEDVAVFLALFGLWYAMRKVVCRLPGREGTRRGSPLATAVLVWTSVVSLTLVTLAYVAIEHLYFLSTR